VGGRSCNQSRRWSYSDAPNAESGQRDFVGASITPEHNNNDRPIVETDNERADLSGPSVLSLDAAGPQMLPRTQISESQSSQEAVLDLMNPSEDFVPNNNYVAPPRLSSVNRAQQSPDAATHRSNAVPTTSRSSKDNQLFLPDQFLQEFIW
jgi:hypothetical protein